MKYPTVKIGTDTVVVLGTFRDEIGRVIALLDRDPQSNQYMVACDWETKDEVIECFSSFIDAMIYINKYIPTEEELS